MNKIISWILIAFCTSCLFGEEKPTAEKIPPEKVGTHYGSFGLGPIPFPVVPTIAFGYRYQSEKFRGYDLNLRIATAGIHHFLVQGTALYMFYFGAENASYKFYSGVGGAFGVVHSKSRGFFHWNFTCPTLSPEFSFGVEFNKKSKCCVFLELEVGFPTMVGGKPLIIPIGVLSLGIGKKVPKP